jgi:LysM repeat protein
MNEKPPENEHNYLKTEADGPHVWVLVAGSLFVGLIILGIFYGLYTLNRETTPTGTPPPLPVVAAQSPSPGPLPISGTQVPTVPIATPTLTVTPTATAKPPTYTVQQGDTLIEIAYQLNVNLNDLKALNQVSGETIYPDQTLLVPPTVTPWPETGPFPHIVSPGETLLSIAARYQVSVPDIRALNGLTSDTILVDQRILIPAHGLRPPTPTPTPEPWQPAVITETVDIDRWLTTVERGFTLHIDADARAATEHEMSQAVWLVERALDQIASVLPSRLDDHLDVYLVTTLFEAPFTRQRGLGRPEENRIFVVYDENGSPAERVYFTTYALTPLVAAEALGKAASPLLQEGLAVYAGMQILGSESNHYLSRPQLCVAYQRAGQMPRVSRPLTFEGHLGYFDQYLAAGCFVGYLIEQEGWEAFTQVYASGDYQAVYGQSLTQLEQGWTRYLQNSTEQLPLDKTQEEPLEPDELVRTLAAVDDAYRLLWDDFAGTPAQFDRYRQLDQARLAALRGQLNVARELLPAPESSQDEQ